MASSLRMSARLGLAQRAQHVLAQRRGVLRRRSGRSAGWWSAPRSAPTADRPDRRSVDDDVIVEPARGVGVGGRADRCRWLGQRPRRRRSPRAAAGRAPARSEWWWPGRSAWPARRRAAGSQVSGGIRIWARGSISGCRPRHSIDAEGVLAARDRRVVVERHAQRGVEIRRRHRVGADAGQRGADRRDRTGRPTTCGDDPARGQVGGDGFAGVAVLRGAVGGRDRHRVALGAEQVDDAGVVSGPSPTRVAPRVEVTPRIWSTRSAAPVVANALSPGSPTRCSASRSACAYGAAATHIRPASARSRSSQATAAA